MNNMNNINLDQAQGLRKMRQNNRVKVITVTGGKGGVGKSSVTLNVAVAMAAQGKRIPATSGTQSMVELKPAEHAGLIRAFSDMKTQIDVLLVDTAAGISDMVLSFSRAAQDIMVVVCDEPTSITDAYALIKLLSREYGVFRFKVVANMVRSLREGQELFSKLTRVTDRFLDASLELVACIPYDNNVRQAVKKQKVIVDAFPKSPASLAFRALANKAAGWPTPHQPGGHLEFFIETLLHKPSLAQDTISE